MLNECGYREDAGAAGWQAGRERVAFAAVEKRSSSFKSVSQEVQTIRGKLGRIRQADKTCTCI